MFNLLITLLVGSSCPSYANINKATNEANTGFTSVNCILDNVGSRKLAELYASFNLSDPDPETGGDNGKLPPPYALVNLSDPDPETGGDNGKLPPPYALVNLSDPDPETGGDNGKLPPPYAS